MIAWNQQPNQSSSGLPSLQANPGVKNLVNKSFNDVPVSCSCFFFVPLTYRSDQSCTSVENGMHYFFHCLYFHHCWFGGHLQRPILYFLDVLEHQKMVCLCLYVCMFHYYDFRSKGSSFIIK